MHENKTCESFKLGILKKRNLKPSLFAFSGIFVYHTTIPVCDRHIHWSAKLIFRETALVEVEELAKIWRKNNIVLCFRLIVFYSTNYNRRNIDQ